MQPKIEKSIRQPRAKSTLSHQFHKGASDCSKQLEPGESTIELGEGHGSEHVNHKCDHHIFSTYISGLYL